MSTHLSTARTFGLGLLAIVLATLLAACSTEDSSEKFGAGWEQEGERQILAWDIWVTANGRPPGYARWLAQNRDRLPDHSPESWVEAYLADGKLAPSDTPQSVFYEENLDLTSAIRDDSGIGDGFVAWKKRNSTPAQQFSQPTPLERYLTELAQDESEESQREVTAIEALLDRAQADAAEVLAD